MKTSEEGHEGPMTYKQMAEKFGVSVDSLKRHFKNHVVRHIQPIVHYNSAEDGPTTVIAIDGEDYHIPTEALVAETKTRMTICQTEEELEAGRAHTAKVKAYHEKHGDLESFEKQLENLREMYPGFRSVI